MAWTLQAQTKTDLLTAASDIQTALETLATKVTAYNAAWAVAQAEIWTQNESHLGDAALGIGWPGLHGCLRGALVSNGLASLLRDDPSESGSQPALTCPDVHAVINGFLTGH